MTSHDTSWEAAARTTWGAYLTSVEESALLSAIDVAGAPGRSLEIGCDGGRWSRFLHDRGWSITCTDIDPASIELTSLRMPDATCLLISPHDDRWPVQDGSVDLLLICEVPFVTETAWFPAEARRVLRPGGTMMFTHHNSQSYRGWAYRWACKIQRLWRGTRLKPYYYHGPAYSGLRSSLRRLGFQFVHEEGFCWFPFGRRSNSRLIAPAIALERRFGFRRLPALSPWVAAAARLA